MNFINGNVVTCLCSDDSKSMVMIFFLGSSLSVFAAMCAADLTSELPDGVSAVLVIF